MSSNVNSNRLEIEQESDFCGYCDKIDGCMVRERNVRRGYCPVLRCNEIEGLYRYPSSVAVAIVGVRKGDWFNLNDNAERERFEKFISWNGSGEIKIDD